MKSNYYVIPIVVLVVGSLLLSDNLEFAYAITVTEVSFGGSNDSIVRAGNRVFVGSVGSDLVRIYNANTLTLIDNVLTGSTTATITNPQALYAKADATLVYAFGSSLTEIDVATGQTLRILSHGCTDAQSTFDSTTNTIHCATSPLTANTIKTISLETMTVTATSGSVNAGGSPCNQVFTLVYDSSLDKMVVGCGVNNVVAVINGFSLSPVPDYSIAQADAEGVAFAELTGDDHILVCGDGQDTTMLDDTGSAVTVDTTLSPHNCDTGAGIIYHISSGRFLLIDGASKAVVFIDGGLATVLAVVTITTGSFNAQQISAYTNTLAYGTEGTGTNWFVLDSTGIPLGSGGSEEPDDTGGIDCDLPENAQVLICRVTHGECQGNVLTCVGDTVLGNATEGTGLIGGVICAVGFIDCEANPDIKTNGIGYLLLAVALGIEIGILWVASRGDLRQVPTFIWFVATIAIIAALTLFNWIDATMLVLGVIVAVALAAAKARGFFGGDSF